MLKLVKTAVAGFISSTGGSQSMRAPGGGVRGWVAAKIMSVNEASSEDAIASLELAPGLAVVELGPGSGRAPARQTQTQCRERRLALE